MLLCAEQHLEAGGAGEVGGGNRPALLPVKLSVCIFRMRPDTPQAPLTPLGKSLLTWQESWHCSCAKIRGGEPYPRGKYKKCSGPCCWGVYYKSCGKLLCSLTFLLCWCLLCPGAGGGMVPCLRSPGQRCVHSSGAFTKANMLQKGLCWKSQKTWGKWWLNQTSQMWTRWLVFWKSFNVCNWKKNLLSNLFLA